MSALSFLVATAINLFAAGYWLRWLRKRDVYAVKKNQLLMVPRFFAAGLVLAVPVSLIFYDITPTIRFATDEVAYFFLVNAPSEELGKFLVFLLVATLSRSVKDPADAAIQGASVGLGFAITENFHYAFQVNPLAMAVRAAMAIAGHGAYTAISATAWGAADYYLGRKRAAGTWAFAALGLVIASLAHASFNALTSTAFWIVIEVALFTLLSITLSDSRKLSPYFNLPLKEWRKAVRWIDYGLDRDPGNWILHQRRGMYLLHGGRLEESERSFRRAVKEGTDPFPRLWLAAVERLQGLDTLESMARQLRRLSSDRRSAFPKVLRRVARTLAGGKALQVEVEALLSQACAARDRPSPSPPGSKRPKGWDPETRARVRAGRRRMRATLAAREEPPRPVFRNAKEHAFSALIREREERKLLLQ